MERDLTVGSLPGQLIRFAFPLFLSNLLQSCYYLVDMAVVGRFVGGPGLAAVSSASKICFLITSLGMGITIGGSVLVAQRKGARDEQGQRDAAKALLFVSAASSLALTALGLLVYKRVLAAMDLPAEAFLTPTAICASSSSAPYSCSATTPPPRSGAASATLRAPSPTSR